VQVPTSKPFFLIENALSAVGVTVHLPLLPVSPAGKVASTVVNTWPRITCAAVGTLGKYKATR